MEKLPVTIYTDGACSGNPGAGGWAAVILYGDQITDLTGGEDFTTNNRMELMAAIESLQYVKINFTNYSNITIYTDSKYVRNGITIWISNWKKNGWRTASKDKVKNVDLWMRLDEFNHLLCPEWRWVKGHDGDKHNEKCNELAINVSKIYKNKTVSQSDLL